MWDKGRGEKWNKIGISVFQLKYIKPSETALIYEDSHTKKGFYCIRKGATAGLSSGVLYLES